MESGRLLPELEMCEAPQRRGIGKNRVILNRDLAVEIYKHKLSLIKPRSFESCFQGEQSKLRGASIKLASKYGVSAKTVRDVWNHKSWVAATYHLWKAEEHRSENDQVHFRLELVRRDFGRCKNLNSL
jgi:hypothetical protein